MPLTRALVASFVALVALAGCASAQQRCAVGPSSGAVPLRDSLRVVWIDDDRYLKAPFPTVHARGDGARVRFVLDTGANMHLVERSVAWWLSLPPKELEAGRRDRTLDQVVVEHAKDGSGQIVAVQAFGPAHLSIGLQGARRLEGFMAAEMQVIVEAGIGGLLSPQRLAPEGRALDLDLSRSVARVLSRGASLELLAPAPGFVALTSIRRTDDGVSLFSVGATIDGQQLRLVVDTGSDRTEIYEGSALARRLLKRPGSRGWKATLGGTFDVHEIEDVPVELSGLRRRMTVSVTPHASQEDLELVQGVAGIDLLVDCRIILARAAGALRCGS